jgi:high-affinity iron transporter
MAAFLIGFGETLVVAMFIALVTAVVRRAGRRELIQAVWYGLGTGLLVSFSVGTGLASRTAAGPAASYAGLHLVMALMAGLAFAGLAMTTRRSASEAAPGWLAILAAMLAVLPHGIALMGRLELLTSTLPVTLGGAAAGVAIASLLGVLLHVGLVRVRLSPFRQAGPRRLATVKQEVDKR